MPSSPSEKSHSLPHRPKQALKELRWKIFLFVLSDPTSSSLLLSNLLVIGTAIVERWSISTVLYSYLAQSIVIGVFTVIKVLTIKDFSTEGLKINNKEVDPTSQTKKQLLTMFILFYGLAHFAYAFFIPLFTGYNSTPVVTDWRAVFISCLYFTAHHLFSFVYHRNERALKPNIGNIVVFPIFRIFPMHITIVIGGFIYFLTGVNVLVLLFFLLLKTVADLLMHLIEHFSSNTEASPLGGVVVNK